MSLCIKNKFGILPTTELLFLDETDTVVDEEVMHDLLDANPSICLLAKDCEEFTPTDCSTPNSSTLQVLDVEMSSLSTSHQSSVAEGAHTAATDDAAEIAKKMVQEALEKNAGGQDIIEEYIRSKTLTHNTRRHLVNILVSHMVEKHGRVPVRMQKEKYGLGIVTLFPNLRDPFSTKGYEHFYDGVSGTGYLAWRLKTVQRKVTKRSVESSPHGALLGGPSLKRSIAAEQQADGDAVREAISLLLHSSDDAVIRSKMRDTFQHRHEMVHNPEMTTEVLKTYPRFLDVKGLINQDFTLLFGGDTSSKLLEKWDSTFKSKIIEEARCLTPTHTVRHLLMSAENQDTEPSADWDSDIAALLLLVHLLPPQPIGKKAAKISADAASERLVVYHKSCCSFEEALSKRDHKHPYLLAAGRNRNRIDQFYIALDKKLIPCEAASAVGAFDELFKLHFVFNLAYDDSLHNFYTFVQTTVYNIDIGKTKESPRVREFRAKLLN
ncbi:uncharacterized protein LOC134098292 [Sardina pilchardus]|uniref:uncharacterized protein LOC134098292 n=1 Tax=Sardina pilchardus TaxID=27697 RepID=UPI002E125E2E